MLVSVMGMQRHGSEVVPQLEFCSQRAAIPLTLNLQAVIYSEDVNRTYFQGSSNKIIPYKVLGTVPAAY